MLPRRANALPIALIAIAIVGFLFLLVYSISGGKSLWSTRVQNTNTPNTNSADQVCAQDVQLCPDGSYVSRTGPTCEFSACPDVPGSSYSNINGAASGSLLVALMDSRTQTPIGDTIVALLADNGTRCVTEPCPTNERTWRAKTNDRGLITIPTSMVDASMTFTIGGYQSAELHVSGDVQTDGSWILRLNPDTTTNTR